LIDVIDASKKVEFSKASLSIPTQTLYKHVTGLQQPSGFTVTAPPPQGIPLAHPRGSHMRQSPYQIQYALIQWLWQWLWTPGGGGKQQPAAAASPHQSNTPLIQSNTPLIKFNTPLIKSLFSGFGSGFGFFGGWGGAAGGGGY